MRLIIFFLTILFILSYLQASYVSWYTNPEDTSVQKQRIQRNLHTKQGSFKAKVILVRIS